MLTCTCKTIKLCYCFRQQVANNRRMTLQPPSACILEINLKGVKIIVQDECRTSERVCPLLYTQMPFLLMSVFTMPHAY